MLNADSLMALQELMNDELVFGIFWSSSLQALKEAEETKKKNEGASLFFPFFSIFPLYISTL